MRLSIAALLLALPALACAQEMNKCKDATGKITYTSQPCENLRLQPAGEVKGQISVTPAYQPTVPPSPPPAASPPAAPPAQPPAPAAEPERRCFKTAGGTRCNDVPTGTDSPQPTN